LKKSERPNTVHSVNVTELGFKKLENVTNDMGRDRESCRGKWTFLHYNRRKRTNKCLKSTAFLVNSWNTILNNVVHITGYYNIVVSIHGYSLIKHTVLLGFWVRGERCGVCSSDAEHRIVSRQRAGHQPARPADVGVRAGNRGSRLTCSCLLLQATPVAGIAFCSKPSRSHSRPTGPPSAVERCSYAYRRWRSIIPSQNTVPAASRLAVADASCAQRSIQVSAHGGTATDQDSVSRFALFRTWCEAGRSCSLRRFQWQFFPPAKDTSHVS